MNWGVIKTVVRDSGTAIEYEQPPRRSAGEVVR